MLVLHKIITTDFSNRRQTFMQDILKNI